jgi:hypothetical protein
MKRSNFTHSLAKCVPKCSNGFIVLCIAIGICFSDGAATAAGACVDMLSLSVDEHFVIASSASALHEPEWTDARIMWHSISSASGAASKELRNTCLTRKPWKCSYVEWYAAATAFLADGNNVGTFVKL